MLARAFPQHSLAVFARYYDQRVPALIQILGSDPVLDDIDLQERSHEDRLSKPQAEAVRLANRVLELIGDDEEIWRYLDSGSEQHEDWYEFDLQLDEPCTPVDA